MESEQQRHDDLTKNLHPTWHQARRIVQDLMFLFPKLIKPRRASRTDDSILEKLSPEARERYLKSLGIK